MATSILEAEASVLTVQERWSRRMLSLWIDLYTLPQSNPVAKLDRKAFQRFASPLQRVAKVYEKVPAERMKEILPFTLSPWQGRAQVKIGTREEALSDSNIRIGITIAVSCSKRNKLVSIGIASQDMIYQRGSGPFIQAATVAPYTEQNLYTVELEAISRALRKIPLQTYQRQTTVLSSNQAVIQAITHPQQQSEQQSHREIYKAIAELKTRNNSILISWIPICSNLPIQQKAKQVAAKQVAKERHSQSASQRANPTRPRRPPSI